MNEQLPVLYIVDSCVAVTGAFMAARNTAILLKDSVRVVMVVPDGCDIPPAMLADFWRVDRMPMVGLSKNLPSLLRYVPSVIIGAWRLKKNMKLMAPTRLQLNDFYLMYGLPLRLMGFSGRIISWVRCHPARFAGPLAPAMLWLAARSANRMVAVSNAIRALLPATAAIDVVYEGYAGPTRALRTWQAADEKRFVYIGNYIQDKGQDVALEAFARIAKQDATVRLAFYGGDMGREKNRAYRLSLEQYVVEHVLQDRVTFQSFTADTYAVLEPATQHLIFRWRNPSR